MVLSATNPFEWDCWKKNHRDRRDLYEEKNGFSYEGDILTKPRGDSGEKKRERALPTSSWCREEIGGSLRE